MQLPETYTNEFIVAIIHLISLTLCSLSSSRLRNSFVLYIFVLYLELLQYCSSFVQQHLALACSLQLGLYVLIGVDQASYSQKDRAKWTFPISLTYVYFALACLSEIPSGISPFSMSEEVFVKIVGLLIFVAVLNYKYKFVSAVIVVNAILRVFEFDTRVIALVTTISSLLLCYITPPRGVRRV